MLAITQNQFQWLILVLPTFIGAFEEFCQFSPNVWTFTQPDSGLTYCLGLSWTWDLSRLILTKAWLRPRLFCLTQLSTSLCVSGTFWHNCGPQEDFKLSSQGTTNILLKFQEQFWGYFWYLKKKATKLFSCIMAINVAWNIYSNHLWRKLKLSLAWVYNVSYMCDHYTRKQIFRIVLDISYCNK